MSTMANSDGETASQFELADFLAMPAAGGGTDTTRTCVNSNPTARRGEGSALCLGQISASSLQNVFLIATSTHSAASVTITQHGRAYIDGPYTCIGRHSVQ